MKSLIRFLPWMLLALFLAEIVAVLMPKSESGFQMSEFGRLPVLMNGRIQPFDSVGRNALLQIRGTSSLALEEVPSWQFWRHAKKLTSTEWLLEVMTKPDAANQRPVFLIHHPELLRTLRLDRDGIERSGLRYYTYNQVRPCLGEIKDLASRFQSIEAKLRTPYQQQLLNLNNAVVLYQRLQLSLKPSAVRDLESAVFAFQQIAPAGVAALRAQKAGQSYDAAVLSRFSSLGNGFVEVANSALPMVVPPKSFSASKDAWRNFGVGLLDWLRDGEMSPAVHSLAAIAGAYTRGDPSHFNQSIKTYQSWLDASFSGEARKGAAEYYFNRVQAFLHAMIIYLAAFLLAAGALATRALAPGLSESLRRSSVYLIALALAVHTFGLIFRMTLEGRPPVTNLYSSAIFIGWGAVLLGLALERFYKIALGSAVASLTGFTTLIIAHNLALGGDTMEMLQAVLDTNFWLATHVTTVTIGYASTFLAGLLGIAYVVLGLGTGILKQKLRAVEANPGNGIPDRKNKRRKAPEVLLSTDPRRMEIGKALSKMIYGIVCFATLFSFVGTVLGGIWADQSWGRFWGWDPKENGALIIVLWNALILHARWCGMVRDRGMAVLAVFGNTVTSFSWFGVNMLGIGLHSYGFMDAAFHWLMLFFASQMLIVGLGLVPIRYWRSFRVQHGSRTAEPVPAVYAGRKQPVSKPLRATRSVSG